MKTLEIFSNHRIPFLISLVILFFTCTACSENLALIGVSEETEDLYGDKLLTDYIRVLPTGTVAHVFDGDVTLEFSPGTVATATRYKVLTFPLDYDNMEGVNVMKRAFTLTNITNDNKMNHPVKITMRYDLAEYTVCDPCDETDLTIYHLWGDQYAYHGIESIGECLKDCSCKTICGCIFDCGSYLVGEY